MNIKKTIAVLDKYVHNPSDGLPDEIFYFISKVTPLVNVDLLIKDEKGRTLLAWRNDRWCGRGWHIPGGIIRFKETLEKRVEEVAKKEIGVCFKFDKTPLAVNQMILPKRDIRGHFISILYRCFLPGKYILNNSELSEKDAGFLKWHDRCPVDLIKHHGIYRKYINSK